MDIELDKFIVTENITVLESLKAIDKLALGVVFVVDQDKQLIGSLSDGDVRRYIISGGQLTKSVRLMCKTNCYSAICIADIDFDYILKQKIKVVPIVDQKGKLISVWIESAQVNNEIIANHSLQNIPVIIMAGGQGTRLHPFTKILPKPLIPIGNKPIAELIIDNFLKFGASDFIFSVNYKASMVRAYFNDIERSYKVTFIEEEKPLGTAGSLFLLKNQIKGTLIVVNCDILIQANYAKVMEYHKQSGNKLTLVGAVRDYQIPYGVVEYANGGGTVIGINEKPVYHFTVNSGMYFLEHEVLDYIPENEFFHVTHLMETLISKGIQVGCYPVHGDAWLDMGQLEEMKLMIQRLGVI